MLSPDLPGMESFDRAMMHDHWDSVLPVDWFYYAPEFGSLSERATIVREAVRTGIEA